jgi:hypothetical protein
MPNQPAKAGEEDENHHEMKGGFALIVAAAHGSCTSAWINVKI